MIRHRLTIDCDYPGCRQILVSRPLRYHGSAGDAAELQKQAIAMGWAVAAAVAAEDRTEGPWHYCPAHSREINT